MDVFGDTIIADSVPVKQLPQLLFRDSLGGLLDLGGRDTIALALEKPCLSSWRYFRARLGFKQVIGWPVARLNDDLKAAWVTAAEAYGRRCKRESWDKAGRGGGGDAPLRLVVVLKPDARGSHDEVAPPPTNYKKTRNNSGCSLQGTPCRGTGAGPREGDLHHCHDTSPPSHHHPVRPGAHQQAPEHNPELAVRHMHRDGLVVVKALCAPRRVRHPQRPDGRGRARAAGPWRGRVIELQPRQLAASCASGG
ncbi:hypothetical protein TCAP_04412 [Tolypocladium capitatum]|uniref:Uncharacterized protein n=1 Tax=Tolypocladium capitatum TaxID=45235 RepID=A0A2K3QDQ4_9HYPO|nr:hypothetical protein TCAP_04412 [Tolypocladium capitatum]